MKTKYNNVNVILSGKNLGYGGGNNLGLKNTKTRFALISNPDVEYNENFFDEIDLYLSGKVKFSVIGPSYNDQTRSRGCRRTFFGHPPGLRGLGGPRGP